MAVLNAQLATFTFGGTKVNGIRSFTGMDGQASDIDVTTLDSLAKEYRQGLQDFGGWNMEIFRDPDDAGQAALEQAKNDQATEQCVLTIPTGQVATFDAYCKQISAAGAVDGVLTGNVAMKISGLVVWS